MTEAAWMIASGLAVLIAMFAALGEYVDRAMNAADLGSLVVPIAA